MAQATALTCSGCRFSPRHLKRKQHVLMLLSSRQQSELPSVRPHHCRL